eukprot:6905355-Prymnesium_polylepis.1
MSGTLWLNVEKHCRQPAVAVQMFWPIASDFYLQKMPNHNWLEMMEALAEARNGGMDVYCT